MHVNSKRIAVLGLLLAVDIILIILSGTMEMSTLFFLAGAAFCVGIAVREYGAVMGGGFFFASMILALLLAPVKMYCITYAMMSMYILLSEVAWNILSSRKNNTSANLSHIQKIFWVARFVIFNVMYIPMVIFAPKLIYAGEIHPLVLASVIAGGQVAVVIFEKAYCYFQIRIWNKFRRFL